MAHPSTKSRRLPRKLLRVVALSAGASLAACGSNDHWQGSYAVDASPDDAGTTVHDSGSDVLIGINVNDSGADVIQGTTIQDASVDGDGGADAVTEAFELEWMGGPAEHHFRKARPGIDELPWGTLDTSSYPRDVVEAARATWTESAYTEYKAVAAFSEVLRTLCEAGAPLDVIGMASGFVADEVVHVELTSRMAMELGGGVPRPFDPDALIRKADPSLSPFARANELVLRVSCIAEAFSGRMAVAALRSTTHPLTRAVYERIVADESLHYRLGSVYMEWASERFDDEERARLATIARETLASLASVWRRNRSSDPSRRGPPKRRATIEQIHEIGWIETQLYADQVRAAVKEAIVEPLATYGIPIADAAALFA